MVSKGWKVIGREDKKVDTEIFDFRTSKGVNEKMLSKMYKNQICNHFMGVRNITTKYGLCNTIKLCLWEKGINTLKFFPRTYYINDISEMLDFLEDYKYT